jgi:PAS domain S-box-containing protein
MTNPVVAARRQNHALQEQLAELKVRLAESENMLRAIRSGEVDAIVVDTSEGQQLFVLKGAEQPYREMVETMSEGAVTVTSAGVILYSNQRFAEMAKADLETVIGSSLLAYCSGENVAEIAAAIEASHTSVPRIRVTLLASDATPVPVNMAMRSQRGEGSDSIAVVIADLTKWKQVEVARERALRALRMINAIADVVIHATDEAGLLNGASQAILTVGGYESISIGPSDEVLGASFCRFARSAGNYDGKENAGCIPAEPTPGGEPVFPRICPHSAIASRDGQMRPARGLPSCVAHDFEDPPSVTVPLISGDEFFGCWVFRASDPGKFDDGELDLLATLAKDLAFGLAAQTNRDARARLAAIVDSAGEPIVGRGPDGMVTSWNHAAEQLFGYRSDEIVGQPLAMLCPPELDGETSRLFERVRHGETIDQFDSVRVAKDGRHIPVMLTFSPVLDGVGDITSAAVFLRDNTARKHAEQALQASEARFRTLLNALPQKIFVKDRAANFVFCNENFANDFRITPDEMIGRNVHAFFPRELADHYSAVDQDALKSGQTTDAEECYVVDGVESAAQIVRVPIRDEHGEVTGLLGIFWDISERKQNEARLRESEQIYRTLTDAMPQLVWMCTPDGLNIYFNQQWADYTGLTLEASYGRGWNPPFHPEDRQNARDVWNRATRTGESYRVESRLRAADGRYRWFLMKGEPLIDATGQIVKWLGTGTDIDELKSAQAELLQHRQHLEESVAARTAELATANEALAKTNKELESFSYSVSHDLRAPLRAIDGFSAILLEDYSDKLDADGKRMLGLVREGSVKMAQLIDDILDFSRAGRAAMTMGVIDMNALVRSALADLASTIKGRALELRVATLPEAYGDSQTIERVWMNLLDNALKYSAPKQPAVIEVGVREVDGTTAYFVKDNGVGFDMQYADKLFGLFQRLHSPGQFPGTGCGLAIVERIVTRNGGRLWAEGHLDHGATFYFILPSTKEHHE